MPNLNQRGPEGQGPATGRRMGKCTNFGAGTVSKPDTENSEVNSVSENFRRGFGFGRRSGNRGRGMGMQNRFRGGN